MRRLNSGCGDWREPRWGNSDVKDSPRVVSCDIREGLAFEVDWFDYGVSIHGLPEIAYPDLVPCCASCAG